MRIRGYAIAIVMLVVYAACGPVYDGPDVAPNKPPKKRPPATVDAPKEIPWDNNCVSRFNGPNAGIRRDTKNAEIRTQAGDRSMDESAKKIVAKERALLIVSAINAYKDGLNFDPYAADATYGLAIAYAQTLRKRCALDMLQRLYTLTANPSYATRARAMIDSSLNEPAFERFRAEATVAVGR
jgi:hypothetical protein